MSAARKPVIVRKLARDWCAGYTAANLAADSGDLEMLDTTGKLLRIAWNQVKWVCFVRELGTFDPSASGMGIDSVNPERLLRRRFTSRPRLAGLWLRMTLTDGDELEGVAANDRSLVEAAGLLLTPPDTRSNTQRVFVPRNAIRELTILAVIAPPGNAPRSTSRRFDNAQPDLFQTDPGEDQSRA